MSLALGRHQVLQITSALGARVRLAGQFGKVAELVAQHRGLSLSSSSLL